MKTTRRQFLRQTAAAAVFSTLGKGEPAPTSPGSIVNDLHSQLNATRVANIVRPRTMDALQGAVRAARDLGRPISIAGGRHAMGGQQFGTDTTLIDLTGLDRVLDFDAERGTVTVEAGIMWPKLIETLAKTQENSPRQWGIIQKQTGADRLSLGGALASNVHGRGLKFKPIIDNVESFELLDAGGDILRCDRQTNPELFRLVIGGYGLFGIVTTVKLRLWERKKVQRIVEIRDVNDIPRAFEQRIADGYLYGDFQFATDSRRDSFLRRGVFSCYRPVSPDTPLTQNPTRFRPEDWARLTYYSHAHKRLAFSVYTKRYLATSGQIYWADSQLSGAYVDDYHLDIDRKTGATVKATEMITEIYVPRNALVAFMEDARRELRRRDANLIYGTVRLIEKDDESFLAWAKQPFACVIFNLHMTHDQAGITAAADAFRSLIDLGIAHNGSYYLTYHRYATREQVERCYPQFPDFLRLKRRYDPNETFQSDWYRHYRGMFG